MYTVIMHHHILFPGETLHVFNTTHISLHLFFTKHSVKCMESKKLGHILQNIVC
jgi:hypothetical protein